MIYPQGKTIHQNLSAEYTDVPQLLSALEGSNFSGVVEIEGGGKKGVFFIAAGQMINAVVGVDSDPPAVTGDHAVPELLALARQPQGLLHVHELTTAQVELAAGPLKSELVFKELSTDFIRMEQFVKKLGEEKHTGYIEIFAKDNKRIGTLSLRNGDPVALQTLSESGQATLFEGEAIPSVLDNAVRHGALFNVYRTAGLTEAAGKAADPGLPDADGPARKAPAPPVRPKREQRPVSEPMAAPQMEAREPVAAVSHEEPVKEPKELPAPAKEPPAPAKEPPAPAKQPPASAKQPPAPAAEEARPQGQETDDASMNGRKEFISALQRVLSKIESFIDHISKKGDFQRVFRQTCVDASDLFHFLDPFEGQFEYDSGKIRIDDAVGSDDFAMATAYCLNLSLVSINKEYLKGAALPPGLKGEIESAFRHYKEVIKNTGLQSVVPASMR